MREPLAAIGGGKGGGNMKSWEQGGEEGRWLREPLDRLGSSTPRQQTLKQQRMTEFLNPTVAPEAAGGAENCLTDRPDCPTQKDEGPVL